MNEHSLTQDLVKPLQNILRRFVRKLNDEIGTGTEAPKPVPHIVTDSSGWAYPPHDPVRERYERDCI